jgi:hypothetical protein
MNTFLVDFAFCPCGELTAIQPTKPVIPDTNPQPYGSVEGSIVVACTKCKRVYRFDTGYLKSFPLPMGIGPDNPQAPMSVFRVPIECDDLNCSAQIVVHIMLRSSTTAAELEDVQMSWTTSEMFCPSGGHRFQWPPYRH